MELRETFDEVAELYEAARSGYPKALFDDLTTLCGLAAGERVLEVGCGTGQATRGLLACGLQVLALDPGANLIALARQRFAASPEAEFVVSSFEDFDPEPGAFRLVASAQAWHWVPPQIAFPKAAQALSPGGWLAVFGHVPGPPPEPVAQALAPVYARLAPELWGPPPHAWYLPQGPVRGLIEGSGLFGPVEHRPYAWSRRVSPAQVVQQLRTRSDYNVLPADRREALLQAVEDALADRWREIEVRNETHLYLAAVRA